MDDENGHGLICLQARESAREQGSGATDEGKRKRPCQDSSSEKLQKKHKHESSTAATPTKVREVHGSIIC